MRRQHVGGMLLVLIMVVSVVAMGVGPGTVTADETVEDDVATVNDEYIPVVNELVSEANEELEEVDDVEKTDPVEAETRDEALDEADRLQGEIDRYPDDILGSIVEEINIQAEEEVGQYLDGDLIDDPVETPDDAREQADYIEENFGDLSDEAERAYEGLRDAADGLEEGEDALESAIFILEGGSVGSIAGGPVEDTDTGEPIEGVTVEVEDGPSSQTDEDGMYEISGVPEGDHTLIVHGADEESEDVTVEEDEETAVEGVVIEAPEDDDEEDNNPGLLLGSVVLDIGSVLAVLTLVLGLAFAGVGALKHSQDENTLEIEALDLSLTMDDFRHTGKAVGFFVAAGVAIGLAAFFAVDWVVEIFGQDEVVPFDELAQLTALVLVFLVGPALGIVYGITEGRGDSSRERTTRTTIAALVGTVLLVILAMLIIGFAGDGGGDMSVWTSIAIAGLVGVVSAIASVVGLAVTGRSGLGA